MVFYSKQVFNCVSSPFLFCDQRIEGETKTAKSWRHPLSKPPARSPLTLVKQQATSDEGELVTSDEGELGIWQCLFSVY